MVLFRERSPKVDPHGPQVRFEPMYDEDPLMVNLEHQYDEIGIYYGKFSWQPVRCA